MSLLKNKKLIALQIFAGFFFLFNFQLKSGASSIYFAPCNYWKDNSPKTYDFNTQCISAYNKMMAMHFDEANVILQKEKKEHPNNLIPVFIENYEDFFRITFNEDVNELNKLEPNKEIRLAQLIQGPTSSPYYYYCKAEVELQWAMARLKFEQYSTAFFEIKKAYSELMLNKTKFPEFIANNKSLGLIHALIGTVPTSYQWAVSFMGFSGNVNQGMTELKSVLDPTKKSTYIFYDEARYLYMFLLFNLENKNADVWDICNATDFPDVKTNPLACFMKGYFARKAGKNDDAISILSNQNFGIGVFKIFYLDYLLGCSKLNRLDVDSNVPLERFITNFKGLNYLKDAYQKLGWFQLSMNSNYDKYDYYLNFCKTKGAKFIDSDKQAFNEATTETAPNITLLKSKLLFDGGYFQQAISLLAGKSTKDFLLKKDQIEFTYRAGRIYHEWGKPNDAKGYYVATINLGGKEIYYFAANAALELGYIYEAENDLTKAKYYYQKCLDMPNTEYKNSLDQKAKAALNRLNSK